MIVLGIESSCDELSMSLVENGRAILSLVTHSQIEEHSAYQGVVPELASRLHAESLLTVYRKTLAEAGLKEWDAVAVTTRPGLAGSLLVGLSFAKGLAHAREKPILGVDHLLAHLYAPNLEGELEYPFLGLLVSGGHTLICRVDDPLHYTILGTTVDDAIGEAFDKVAKHLDLGYPGGPFIDKLAAKGNPRAYHFPLAKVLKGRNPCDMSFSGLKTAVIYQRSQFQSKLVAQPTEADLVASFQKAAIKLLLNRLEVAVLQTGINRVVAGGGVAANSYLRAAVQEKKEWQVRFPSLELCGDNGAMIAALGWEYAKLGEDHGLGLQVSSRAVREAKTNR